MKHSVRRFTLIPFFVMMSLLLLPLTLFSADEDVLAELGDMKITSDDLEAAISLYPEIHRKRLNTDFASRKRILQDLVMNTILSKQAKESGFDKNEEIQKQLEYVKNTFIAKKYMDDILFKGVEIDDIAAKSYYENNKKNFTMPERVRAKHILIKVRKDASKDEIDEKKTKIKGLLEKIKGGEKFEDLARKFSEDVKTKMKGGDLGFFPKGRMAPEFDKAVFSLNKGEVSDPVKTKFGFHIIKVEDKKPASIIPFDKIKQRVKSKALRERKEKKTSEFMDKNFKDKGGIIYDHKLMKAKKEKKDD